MHWNTLSQHLISRIQDVKKEYLSWEYRCQLIKKHIQEMSPDVLGISELEQAGGELLQFLKVQMKYDNVIVPDSNTLAATAVFFKRDQFKCLKKGHINTVGDLADENASHTENPMVYCHLEEKSSQLQFVFAEVQLLGNRDAVDKGKGNLEREFKRF